jgi:hypothetical protein
MCKRILILLISCLLFAPSAAFTLDNEEFLNLDFQITNVFELGAEIMIDPGYTPPDPSSLDSPSSNTVVPGKDLGNNFDFGTLLKLKASGEIHLVSEYKILVKLCCLSNIGKKYSVTHHLVTPITGQNSGITFPPEVFVARAFFTPSAGIPEKGQILLAEPTPVSIADPQKVFISNAYIGEDLSNYISIEYWITDNCPNPLLGSQRADIYTAVIIITMSEEL